MRGGKDLHPHAIEEPRCIRRDVRRLIGPVIKVVITEETYVRHENSSIYIDAMQLIEVISAIRLREVAIGIGEVPLAASRAGVVARRGLRIQAELRHQPGADGVIGKAASTAKLRHVDFT